MERVLAPAAHEGDAAFFGGVRQPPLGALPVHQ
jgi:hypothetical protein